MISVNVDFRVSEDALPALDSLLKKSKHADPILAIIMQGTGPTGSEIELNWTVTTYDNRILELAQFFCFRNHGYTFYSTHSDMEWLRSKLNHMSVSVVDGELKVFDK